LTLPRPCPLKLKNYPKKDGSFRELKNKTHWNDVNQSCNTCCMQGLVTCSISRAVLYAWTNDLCHGFGRTAISSRWSGNFSGTLSRELSRGSRRTKSTINSHNTNSDDDVKPWNRILPPRPCQRLKLDGLASRLELQRLKNFLFCGIGIVHIPFTP
jgi:hypothetical protein